MKNYEYYWDEGDEDVLVHLTERHPLWALLVQEAPKYGLAPVMMNEGESIAFKQVGDG